MTERTRFVATTALISCALAACCGCLLWHYVLDDAFITYRYANNLAGGLGMLYHPGEAVLGTTTPGYTIVLAGLHALTGVAIPTLSKALGILFSALAATLLALLMASVVHRVVAVAAGALLASNPVLHLSAGMEAPLYVALILLLFLVCQRRQSHTAGLVLGLAALVRPDALALGVVPALTWLRAPDRGKAWLRVGTMALIVVAPWLIYAVQTYGTPVPSSFAAKQHLFEAFPQAEFHRLFVQGFITLPRWFVSVNPCVAVFAPLVIVGAAQYSRRLTNWTLALALWSLAYVAAFEWVDVPNLSVWYWAPLQLLFVACIGFAIDAGLRLAQEKRLRFVWSGLALACAVVVAIQISTIAMLEHSWRADAYRALGQELECNATNDATIASWEIGIIGYYSNCRILDFAGIANPDSVGRRPDQLIELHQPAWVVAHAHDDYVTAREFEAPDNVGPSVFLYRRKSSSD